MPETVALGLPLIAAEQAQKHVTHNEAMRALDAIVQLAVKDRDLAAPPGSPADGDRYIVAAAASGAWTGHESDVAAWQDGAWEFHNPRAGWQVWVEDESIFLAFDGSDWVDWVSAIASLQNIALLGVGTIADSTNPFSAKLNKALWTAKYAAESGDGDLRFTMNKETTSDVVSLLLQAGYSGRAEIGLIGDNDLLFKVSADGSTWHEGLRIDKSTGAVSFPNTSVAPLASPAFTGSASFAGLITSLAPTGHIFLSDPAIDANDGGFKFLLNYGAGLFTNGPVGEVNYTDDVWTAGINIGSSGGVRYDTAKAAYYDQWEARYYTGGKFCSERHWAFIDAAGGYHRPIHSAMPHDGGTGSLLNLQIDTVNMIAFDQVTQRVKFNNLAGTVQLFNSTQIQGMVNGASVLKQVNAAGSAFVDLIHLNGGDWIELGGSASILGMGSITGLLTSLAPSGAVFRHDPAIDPNDGGFKFSFGYAAGTFTNGPVGETNYSDDVWVLGLNVVDGGGGRIDTAKAALYDQWEARYYSGGKFGSERHWNFVDLSGVAHRPLHSFFPHDGGTGSLINIQVDTVNMVAFDGTTQRVKFDNLGGVLTLFNSTFIRGMVNNTRIVQQVNAAGSAFVDLLKLDSGDIANIGAPLYVSAARAGAAATFPGNFAVFQPTSANSGDVGMHLPLPTVTGSMTAYSASGAESTGIKNYLANTNSSAATAHAWQHLLVSGASAGDPFVTFEVSGATAWSLGIDNSDSDKFKLSASGALGTTDMLVVDTSGNAVATGTIDSGNSIRAGGTGSLRVFNDSGVISLGAGNDLLLGRVGAANLRHGAADAAAPVAQTISVQNVLAGTTDTAGANLTIAGSRGTGTGKGGDIVFQTVVPGSTGSAQNALATVLTLSAAAGAKVSAAGSLQIGGSSSFVFSARGTIQSPADGQIALYNNALSDFSRLMFGGTTSGFPALKRNSVILEARLADDSGLTQFSASTLRTGTPYTVSTLPAAGNAGRRAYVTDATAPTFLGTLTGGGAIVTPVFDNGTAWVAG